MFFVIAAQQSRPASAHGNPARQRISDRAPEPRIARQREIVVGREIGALRARQEALPGTLGKRGEIGLLRGKRMRLGGGEFHRAPATHRAARLQLLSPPGFCMARASPRQS